MWYRWRTTLISWTITKRNFTNRRQLSTWSYWRERYCLHRRREGWSSFFGHSPYWVFPHFLIEYWISQCRFCNCYRLIILANNHVSLIDRQLRSSTSQQLSIPRTKLNLGKRAFSIAAPIIWNEVPTTLKSCESLASFRKNLKTYLIKIAFPP